MKKDKPLIENDSIWLKAAGKEYRAYDESDVQSAKRLLILKIYNLFYCNDILPYPKG